MTRTYEVGVVLIVEGCAAEIDYPDFGVAEDFFGAVAALGGSADVAEMGMGSLLCCISLRTNHCRRGGYSLASNRYAPDLLSVRLIFSIHSFQVGLGGTYMQCFPTFAWRKIAHGKAEREQSYCP